MFWDLIENFSIKITYSQINKFLFTKKIKHKNHKNINAVIFRFLENGLRYVYENGLGNLIFRKFFFLYNFCFSTFFQIQAKNLINLIKFNLKPI